MAEMSSFYGGRQGFSFVISKRFDGIDIPQTTYTNSYYATMIDKDNNELYITTKEATADGATLAATVQDNDGKEIKFYFIEQTSTNVDNNDYIWKFTKNNGQEVTNVKYDNTNLIIDENSSINITFNIKKEEAEGMVQCFEKGIETASEVPYGTYVIIDSVSKLKNYNNLDSGKIFRRGMNIDSTDGLAGAEYIGNFIGPEGKFPEISIVGDIDESSDYYISNYMTLLDPDKEDEIDDTNESERKNYENIKLSYRNVKDENTGKIIKCEIGVQSPYLKEHFDINKNTTPYDSLSIVEDDTYFNASDEKWKNPFRQGWILSIPGGKNGNDIEGIEIIPTKILPLSTINTILSYENKDQLKGIPYYENDSSDDNIKYYTGTNNLSILDDGLSINYNSESNRYPVQIDDETIGYVPKEYCYNYIARCKEINYKENQNGIATYKKIGEYNIIKKIFWGAYNNYKIEILDNNGLNIIDDSIKLITNMSLSEDNKILTIDYNNGTSIEIKDPLEYIKTVTLEKEVDEDDSDYNTGLYVTCKNGEKKYLGAINFIDDVIINSNNHLLIHYTSKEYRTNNSNKIIEYDNKQWIDYGSVKGESGGINSIGNFSSVNDLPGAPEIYTEDPNKAGWCCTVTNSVNNDDGTTSTKRDLYFYDYTKKEWYKIGTFDDWFFNLNCVNVVSSEIPSNLKEGGIWFATTNSSYGDKQ